MSAGRICWMVVFGLILSSHTAGAADQLPAGAISRLKPSATKYGDPDFPSSLQPKIGAPAGPDSHKSTRVPSAS